MATHRGCYWTRESFKGPTVNASNMMQQLLPSRSKVDIVNSEFPSQQIVAACGDSLYKIIEHCPRIDVESQQGLDTFLGQELVVDLDFVEKLKQ